MKPTSPHLSQHTLKKAQQNTDLECVWGGGFSARWVPRAKTGLQMSIYELQGWGRGERSGMPTSHFFSKLLGIPPLRFDPHTPWLSFTEPCNITPGSKQQHNTSSTSCSRSSRESCILPRLSCQKKKPESYLLVITRCAFLFPGKGHRDRKFSPSSFLIWEF